MKLKSPLLIITALLGVTIATCLAGDPSAKSKAAKTTAKAKAKPEEAIPGATVQPAAYFYTGKPYDEDLGGYLFLYRNYSPSTSRWTSFDPSGFQDGANIYRYAPSPTFGLDYSGLWSLKITDDEDGDILTQLTGTWHQSGRNFWRSAGSIRAVVNAAADKVGVDFTGTCDGYKNHLYGGGHTDFTASGATGSGLVTFNPNNGALDFNLSPGTYTGMTAPLGVGLSVAWSFVAGYDERKVKISLWVEGNYEPTSVNGGGLSLGPVGAEVQWGGGAGVAKTLIGTIFVEAVE